MVSGLLQHFIKTTHYSCLQFSELISKETLDIPRHNFLDFGGKLMNINIVETVGLLTRCSFDEKYRDPIISLGGVQTLVELLLVSPDSVCFSMFDYFPYSDHSLYWRKIPYLNYTIIQFINIIEYIRISKFQCQNIEI